MCNKCGHERIPRTANPVKCPVCGHIPGTQIRRKKPKASAPALTSKDTLAVTTGAVTTND